MRIKTWIEVGVICGGLPTRAFRRARPAAVGFAVLVLAAWTLRAGVIDDFNDPVPSWDGVNGSPTLSLGDGQLVISQVFVVPTDPANPFNTFGNIYYLTNQPVCQKQTLELRVDLVSANKDNVFTHLGTMNAAGGEYSFFKDLNEIGLVKWSAVQGCSVAFWETRSIPNQGVVLALSLTSMDDRLVIETKVLRKSDQAVLYRRVVVDGPGVDWPVPNPLPHGWQILTPDAGAPYKDDLTMVWLAMQHQTDGQQGLAELRWDNLEANVYPSPYLEIAGGATLLTWPETTGEEQIVVTADSLSTSVWTPWPEPVFKRFGQCCLAVPATGPQRFGKLVPGRQFIDDFAPLEEPVSTRNPWEPWFHGPGDAPKFVFTLAEGVLRIETLQQPADGMVMVFAPGGGEIVADFHASVDILDWGSSSQNSALGIAGRVQGDPKNGVSSMYLGSLQVNPLGTSGKGGLFFFNGSEDVPPLSNDLFDLVPGSSYRLQFSAVGSRLSLRLLDLTQGQIPLAERTLSVSAFAQGRVALWVNTRGSTSYRRTLDNFFMTGTKP